MARLKGAEQKIQRALEKHRVELETRYKGEAAASITLNLFLTRLYYIKGWLWICRHIISHGVQDLHIIILQLEPAQNNYLSPRKKDTKLPLQRSTWLLSGGLACNQKGLIV